MKSFQTILLLVCAVLVVGAVLVFSGALGGKKTNNDLSDQPIILWSTLDKERVDNILKKAESGGEKFNITYVQRNSSNFEAQLIDALASGKGPDLILVPHTLLLKQGDKLLPIPFTAVSERTFRDSFLEAGEVLLEADHVTALPLYLNPLVMYWNRDMFTRAGIAAPPATWLEVQLLPERLTKLDANNNISEAAVALGGTSNVSHFKEILSAQIIQTGNPIVTRTKEGLLSVALTKEGGADSALRYYTEFANPGLSKYSWNTALRNSLDQFIAGKLAMYFGLASDLPIIQERNPHLNFDTALLPQISDGGTRATYADVYALAVIKNSAAGQSALAVAYQLALGNTAKIVSDTLGLPPARRDLAGTSAPNQYQAVFYKAAIMSKTWYDPNSIITRNIFADMVESVMIGKSSPQEAVTSADARLLDLFNPNQTQ